MEGLEISEVSSLYVNKKERFDSDYFKKKYLAVEELVKKHQTSQLFELSLVSDGDHSKFPDNQKPEVRYLQARDISNNFLEQTSDSFVSEEYAYRNKRSLIYPENILVSIMGTVGDITITPKDFTPAICNRALAIIKDINGVDPYYLFTYLISKEATLSLERLKNGSVQERINLGVLEELNVPILKKDIQNIIRSIVLLAQQYRELSTFRYRNAEVILLNDLNLKVFEPTHAKVNIKNFKDSFLISGRLDAEYYQPKFDELERIIENAASGQKAALGAICSYVRRGRQPDYGDAGLPVVNSKHVRMGKVLLDDNRLAKPLEDSSGLIKHNDVLMNGTGVGTIGRTAPYLATAPAIPDNHVTILRSDEIDPVYLSVFLNSPLGQLQVEKYFKGSSGQIELYPDDIKQFQIWVAPEKTQKSIRSNIEQAYKANQVSQALLEVAKRGVEIAIEQDERTAEKWIQAECAKLGVSLKDS